MTVANRARGLLRLRHLRERQTALELARQNQATDNAKQGVDDAEQDYQRFVAELAAKEADIYSNNSNGSNATGHLRLDLDALQQEYARRLTAISDLASYRHAIAEARDRLVSAEAQRQTLVRSYSRQRKQLETQQHYHQTLMRRAAIEAARHEDDEAEELLGLNRTQG